MNIPSAQQFLLGGNILTTTGDNLYVNGQELYPASNPSGFTTGIPPSVSYNLTINWNSGNVFHSTLTGNVNVSFTGQQDGQTIVVSVTNTGTNGYSGIWPANIRWPAAIIPTQTSGAYTDIYTFVDITGTIYGSSVQGF